MSHPGEPPSQKLVAQLAGVSASTVSLALRGDPRLPPATRRRIAEIARAAGYHHNPLVSQVMSAARHRRLGRHLGTIAYVHFYAKREGYLEFETLRDFHVGMLAQAEGCGYKLEVFWGRAPGLGGQRLSDMLSARGIEGVIISPVPPDASPRLDWPRFALATIGHSLTTPKLHRAVNHQLHTVGLALAELQTRGYQRIGLVMHAHQMQMSAETWKAGLLLYQSNIPARRRIPPLLPPRVAEPLLLEWVRRHRPDAIMALTYSLHGWLVQAGYRVPRDVALVALDWNESTPEWAGVVQNARAVGQAAADLVVAQLRRNERGIPTSPQTLLIEGRWLDGSTVAHVPSAGRRRKNSPKQAASGSPT
jgi:LacI family transcriptional regulator